MGSSSKKTDSSYNQASNTTTTPQNPSWVTDALQNFTGQVSNAAAVPASQRVPGFNSNLSSAFTSAQNLGQASAPLYAQSGSTLDRISNATTGGVSADKVQGASLLDNLNGYMSPYVNDVVSKALAGFDQNAGVTQAQNAAHAAANNAFGDSRYGVQQGVTAGQLALNRGQLSSGLYSDAFNTAAGLSNEDAARRQAADTTNAGNDLSASQSNQSAQAADLARQLQAGGALGDLATAQDANARANVTSQDTEGQVQRGVQGQISNADISTLDQIGQLLSMGQYGLFNGSNSAGTGSGNSTSTTVSTPSILDQIGQGIGAAASVGKVVAGGFNPASFISASDSRLKTDIRFLARDGGGRRWYSYRYLWSLARRIGVMAQEVRKTDPGAVIELPGGFLAVDYAKLAGA